MTTDFAIRQQTFAYQNKTNLFRKMDFAYFFFGWVLSLGNLTCCSWLLSLTDIFPLLLQEEHREPLPPVVEEKEPAGAEEPVIGPSMPETDMSPVVDSRLPSLRGHDLAPTRGKRPRGADAGFVPVEVINSGHFSVEAMSSSLLNVLVLFVCFSSKPLRVKYFWDGGSREGEERETIFTQPLGVSQFGVVVKELD